MISNYVRYKKCAKNNTHTSAYNCINNTIRTLLLHKYPEIFELI